MRKNKKIKYGLSEKDCKGINFSYDYLDEERKKIREKIGTNTKFLINKVLPFILIFNIVIKLNPLFSILYGKLKLNLTKSPFDGNSISMDAEDLNKSIFKVYDRITTKSDIEIQNLIDNMDEKQKKDYLLFSAILENEDFEINDIVYLMGYLDYLKDNEYIDYEGIYKRIKTVNIKRNINYSDGTLGIYNSRKNEIKLSDKYYIDTLSHEFFHLDDQYLYNCENKIDFESLQDWFTEGFSEELSNEYMEDYQIAYTVECSAIKIFTEIIGKEKMFEIRGTGNFNLFFEELANKGVTKKELKKLLETLNSHCYHEKNCCKYDNTLADYEQKISSMFIDLYNKIYNSPKVIPPIIAENIEYIKNRSKNFNNYNNQIFFFNKKHIEKSPVVYEYNFNDKGEFLELYIKKYYENEVLLYKEKANQYIRYYYDKDLVRHYKFL